MTRTKRMLTVTALILAPGAMFGCNRTPAEAHNDGVEAQKQADEKTDEARKEAADKVAEANREVVKANDEARQKAAEAQANANEKIREVNHEIAPPPSDVHDWAQKKLDSVDNMIDGASAKAQTATPTAKAKFNSAIEDVKRQRDVLQTELASLDTHAGDRLDKSKEQFSDHVDRVKDNIRNLEKSL
jgi:phage host-nuclease inhibitor protein Gam